MTQRAGHLAFLVWWAIQMGGGMDTSPAGMRAHTQTHLKTHKRGSARQAPAHPQLDLHIAVCHLSLKQIHASHAGRQRLDKRQNEGGR